MMSDRETLLLSNQRTSSNPLDFTTPTLTAQQNMINNNSTDNNQYQQLQQFAPTPNNTSSMDDENIQQRKENNHSNNNSNNDKPEVIHNWQESPFDPNDKRPFIRKPTGAFLLPCGMKGIKCLPPYPWIWMIPAILVPLTFFCICVPPPHEVWSRVIACLIATGSYVIFFLSNFVDPGIVPPARVGDPEAKPVTIFIPDVGEVELEVCRTCKIVRPPRSSHCRSSDCCQRDYDHYCGVINSVVAQKTFRWFAHFMNVTLLLVIFVFARTVYAVSKEFDYKELIDTGYGRFRLIGSYLLLFFLAFASCWTGLTGFIYSCHYAAADLTLKDLKGRKQFRNVKTSDWSLKSMWIRLCSCGYYPDSELNDAMTWMEEDPSNPGVMREMSVNGPVQ